MNEAETNAFSVTKYLCLLANNITTTKTILGNNSFYSQRQTKKRLSILKYLKIFRGGQTIYRDTLTS